MSTIKKILFDSFVLPFLVPVVRSIIKEHEKETMLQNYQFWGDESRLHLSSTCQVNNAVFNLSSGNITVEDHVIFGTFVNLLTGTHDYNKFNQERAHSFPEGGRDIVVKQGAWIASNAIIIGPCTIGEHAVVAAGSLVKRDVPPYAVVAGVPAVVVKTLEAK